MGDFNAGATNTFGGLLEDFCMENDLIISDYAILPQDTFTYISDAHNFLDRPFCLILFSASSNSQYGCANRVHRLIKPRSHFGKRSITKTDPHHYQHWWERPMVVQRLLKCGKTILKEY